MVTDLIFGLLVPPSLNKANLPTVMQAGQKGKKYSKGPFAPCSFAYSSSFHVLTFLFILLHTNFNVTQQIFILCIILKNTHENNL